METEDSGYLILGKSQNGHKFRPSDWVERLATLFADFERNRIHYSPLVHPANYQQSKCLFVAKDMEKRDPDGFKYLMEFARGNRLVIETIGMPDSHLPTDEIRHVA